MWPFLQFQDCIQPPTVWLLKSHGLTAVTLFTITLLRCGRSTNGATYYEDAGQRLPVRDIATTMQCNCEWPTVDSSAVSTYAARPRWPTAGAMACCQHGNRPAL